jgi:predicted dehydrogenase
MRNAMKGSSMQNERGNAPVRVGILGFGNAGRLIHAPLIGLTPGLSVMAVSSSRPEAVHAGLPDVAVFRDADAMLASPDLDLIVVATPPDTHARWAKAVVTAGKHVLVEKPFTLDLGEAIEVLECASSAGRMVTVFHNRRYDSCFRSVRAVIESGALGRVNHFESQYNRFSPAVQDSWAAPAAPGSGAWYDLGSHVVDQAIQLFGLPEAIGLTLASNRPGSAADDWFHAILHYPDKRAILHSSFLVSGGVPRFTVHGDKASLVKAEMDKQGRDLWAGISAAAPEYGVDLDPPILIEAGGGSVPQPTLAGDYRLFFQALRSAIHGEAPNPTAPLDMLGVMAVLESGLISAREARVIPVPRLVAQA